MTFRRELAYAATCVALWAGRAAGGEANAPDASIVLFKEGVAAGKGGDFARAEAAFRASYALRPSASTLRNWALTEVRLGKMVEALGHLREALKWQGWTAEQRSIVQQNLDDAYGATGHVAIRTTGGARVAIDGIFADRVAPIEGPLDVMAGSRRVEAWLGAQVARAYVEAPPGRLVHVDLPVASPSQETTAPAPASGTTAALQQVGGQGPGAPSRTSTWWSAPHTVAVALAAAGGVGLAFGLYFDARSSSAAADAGALRSALAGRCAGPSVAPECGVLRDQIGVVHRDETLTEFAFAVGATAAVGAAVVLALAGPGAVVRTGSVQWSPQIAPGAAGVAGWF
ncbi:MAG: hypothetical protein M3O36_05870 [Myxococcota bacterium]|nr:hypothetical protein [Myxococcota bacterium]